jgi:hypothetical protein
MMLVDVVVSDNNQRWRRAMFVVVKDFIFVKSLNKNKK